MKNRPLFQKFMVAIGEIFGRKITQLTINTYWEALEDYSDEQCARAFQHVIKHSKRFPSPADIIEAIELHSNTNISPIEARIQIENWLYNGGPEPQDPTIKRVIQSYGGWKRLGMTSYQDLKYLLKDIETRFEAVARGDRRHSYLPEGDTPNHRATALIPGRFSSLGEALEEGLDTLASESNPPVALTRFRCK